MTNSISGSQRGRSESQDNSRALTFSTFDEIDSTRRHGPKRLNADKKGPGTNGKKRFRLQSLDSNTINDESTVWDDDFRSQAEIAPAPKRMRKFMNLTVPIVTSYVCIYLQQQINMVFVGQLNDTEQLAAIGLG